MPDLSGHNMVAASTYGIEYILQYFTIFSKCLHNMAQLPLMS